MSFRLTLMESLAEQSSVPLIKGWLLGPFLNLLPFFLLYTINYPQGQNLFSKFANKNKPEVILSPVVGHLSVCRIDWDKKTPSAMQLLQETGCPSKPQVTVFLCAGSFCFYYIRQMFHVSSLQGRTVALATGASCCGYTIAIWIWSQCQQWWMYCVYCVP